MKFRNLLIGALTMLSLTGCSACTSVEPGNVAVVVKTIGSNKGVQPEPLGVGFHFLGFGKQTHTYPTFQRTYSWTASAAEGSPNDESIHFQSKEGMAVNADVSIRFQVDQSQVVTLFQKHRRPVEDLVDGFIYQEVRDAFSNLAGQHTAQELRGPGKAELIENVNKRVAEALKREGIVVEKVALLGPLRMPRAFQEALNNKVKAKQLAQQRQNEVAAEEANARKKEAKARGDAAVARLKAEADAKAILTRAKAQAEANRIISQSLTPNLIRYKKIEVWNGELPKMTGVGSVMVKLDD